MNCQPFELSFGVIALIIAGSLWWGLVIIVAAKMFGKQFGRGGD